MQTLRFGISRLAGVNLASWLDCQPKVRRNLRLSPADGDRWSGLQVMRNGVYTRLHLLIVIAMLAVFSPDLSAYASGSGGGGDGGGGGSGSGSGDSGSSGGSGSSGSGSSGSGSSGSSGSGSSSSSGSGQSGSGQSGSGHSGSGARGSDGSRGTANGRSGRGAPQGYGKSQSDIMSRAEARVPGDVVGLQFDSSGDTPVYRVRIIDVKGRLIRLRMNARTGEVLSIEGR